MDSALPGWASVLAVLVLVGIFIAMVGWLTSRILGVRRGAGRSLIAGSIGVLGGVWLAEWELTAGANSTEEFLSFAGSALLATLVVSIVIDVIFPPSRHARGGGMRGMIRSARLRWESSRRIAEIARLARSNGLIRARIATPEGARALRGTLEDAGGILVKFGQIASTRDDVLPQVVTDELAHLRTAVPALPADVVTDTIVAELGEPVDMLFGDFDPEPLAAASIGVTHRATLADGRRVIVKVQRPGIEESVEVDGRVLHWGARKLEDSRESFATLQVSAIADELVQSIRRELDFTLEQSNNAAMSANRSGDPGIRFPEILPAMTTGRVLVMDEVDGHPVSDREAVTATGRSPEELADNLLGTFLAQALTDGLFHADPHPGNVLIDAAGDLWLIDYGAVGVVDPVTLEALQQLGAGFVMRDASMLARAVRRMAGSQGTDLDIVGLETDMAQVLSQFSSGGFDPAALEAVASTLARHGVAAPPALTVLGRAALTLEGTLRTIDPEFRMGPRAQGHLSALASAQLGGPRAMLTEELVRSMPSLRSLPQLTEDLGLQARAGSLTIRSERYTTGDGARVSGWIDRALFAAIGMLGFLGSAVMLLAAAMAEGTEAARFLYAFGYFGVVVTAAMLMRSVAQIRHRPRDELAPSTVRS